MNGMEFNFRCNPWWVSLREAGYYCMSSSLKCALECVGICRSKDFGVVCIHVLGMGGDWYFPIVEGSRLLS